MNNYIIYLSSDEKSVICTSSYTKIKDGSNNITSITCVPDLIIDFNFKFDSSIDVEWYIPYTKIYKTSEDNEEVIIQDESEIYYHEVDIATKHAISKVMHTVINSVVNNVSNIFNVNPPLGICEFILDSKHNCFIICDDFKIVKKNDITEYEANVVGRIYLKDPIEKGINVDFMIYLPLEDRYTSFINKENMSHRSHYIDKESIIKAVREWYESNGDKELSY